MVGTMPWAFCVYQMGLGVLSEHMHTVAGLLMNGTPTVRRKDHTKDYQANLVQSLAFVQGSAFDIVIQSYIQATEPSVDPDELRRTFYQMVQYWKRKQASP